MISAPGSGARRLKKFEFDTTLPSQDILNRQSIKNLACSIAASSRQLWDRERSFSPAELLLEQQRSGSQLSDWSGAGPSLYHIQGGCSRTRSLSEDVRTEEKGRRLRRQEGAEVLRERLQHTAE